VSKFWQCRLVGPVLGLLLGWLLSLVSGNVFVIGVGTLGAIVGVVLGPVHRNDP
jgi:hypothetical protein